MAPDIRHDLIDVVDALAPAVPQGESKRANEVFRIGGRETIKRVAHGRDGSTAVENRTRTVLPDAAAGAW